MEWPEFLESSNSQEPAFDLFSAAPYDNYEVTAQADQWTLKEKQSFEHAFSKFYHSGSQTFFEYVASKLPHKSMGQIKNYYLTLFKDVQMENPIPKNKVAVIDVNDHDQDHQHYQLPLDQDDSSDMEATLNGTQSPQVENTCPRRRRGIPWTEGEHELFLMGLNRFGKGDWKNISKYYVVSKTRAQVASHAQKFFSRRNSMTPVERRRPSINDIRTITFRSKAPITVPTWHQINNRLAYENNHQAGSSSLSFHYPYTFGGPTFSNSSNGDFGRFNRSEASGSSSFVMEQNNNNLCGSMSPRPFLSIYSSSATMNNHKL